MKECLHVQKELIVEGEEVLLRCVGCGLIFERGENNEKFWNNRR